MNIEEIKALAEIMTKNGLTHLEINEDDIEITLKREQQTIVAAPAIQQTAAQTTQAETNVPAASNKKEIKSPMVGVFYSSTSPDEEPFISVGDTVKKGDVVCVIETMKLFNEITSDYDGTITEVCAKNEDVVEFGQPLFVVE